LCDKFASKFPEYGLSKLIEGYKVYEAGDGDEAFDLLSVCPFSTSFTRNMPHQCDIYMLARMEWRCLLIVFLGTNASAGYTTILENLNRA
jgi:hypothetical protein